MRLSWINAPQQTCCNPEKLFAEAIRAEGEDRTTDVDALVDALDATEDAFERGDTYAVAARALVPMASADMIANLVTMPTPEQILTGASLQAPVMSAIRKIRRWWWLDLDDLEMDQDAE